MLKSSNDELTVYFKNLNKRFDSLFSSKTDTKISENDNLINQTNYLNVIY